MSDTIEAESNLAKAQRLYESGLSPKVMAELGHPEDLTIIEADSLPYGGTYRGFGSLKGLGKGMSEAFSEMRLEYVGCIGEGDTIVAELLLHFTGRASGKSLSMPVLEIVRFRDGKMVEIKPFYFDTAATLEALAV
jgi:ketosteroid isomerase-like protein